VLTDDDLLALTEIAEAAGRVVSYVDKMDRETFKADDRTRDAVAMLSR
jgi:uncharacterized protein with HEPN domain